MPVCHKKRGDWANTKATYNFWQSKRVECEDIIDAHQKQTVRVNFVIKNFNIHFTHS